MSVAPPAYYNENDPYAAAWLRNLISEGHIASGDVDERSIVDVRPADLNGYGQCHFFAGIGGWSLALRMAGVPDNEPVWTGSCPCQPFSAAGKRGGFDDARHLWPEFFRLIAQRRPATVLGEQVASRDGLQWLDLVSADLEGADYAFGAVDLCAAGVGAPHIRQRLWWVGLADASSERRIGESTRLWRPGAPGRDAADHAETAGGRQVGSVADACGAKRRPEFLRPGGDLGQTDGWHEGAANTGERVAPRGLAVAEHGRREGRNAVAAWEPSAALPSGEGPWSGLEWLPCRDGKARPTQPGLFPLAHGVSGRVGLLRGAGNAIVPEAAATFVRAVMPCA